MKTKTTIKKFLKAKTPEGLEKLQYINNQKWGASFDYENVQFVNGNWFCWYYADIGVISVLEMLAPVKDYTDAEGFVACKNIVTWINDYNNALADLSIAINN